jgi:hypothetical protein
MITDREKARLRLDLVRGEFDLGMAEIITHLLDEIDDLERKCERLEMLVHPDGDKE